MKRAAELVTAGRRGEVSESSRRLAKTGRRIEAKWTDKRERGRDRDTETEGESKGERGAEVWRGEARQPHSDTAFVVSV